MTKTPKYAVDQHRYDGDHGNELHGLIGPDRSHRRRDQEALEYVEAIDVRMKQRLERAERRYFGEDGKERSRRTRIYSHSWTVDKAGYELTPAIAEDAIRLAANCDFELMLSSENPELN